MKEAMKLALEALKNIDDAMPFPVGKSAIKALEEALAKQEQGEPVAWESVLGAVARGWCYEENANKTMDSELAVAIAKEVHALYTTPQQRKPLTQEQIDSIPLKNLNKYNTTAAKKYLVRAVEAMHNIKE
jgi:hypothetical protein